MRYDPDKTIPALPESSQYTLCIHRMAANGETAPNACFFPLKPD